MLLFYIGDDRYALESQRVVEVVPKIALNKLHNAPDYIPGLFNYRGFLVPVIDLRHLIQGTACRNYLSTRIILVNCQKREEFAKVQAPSPVQILGLMAERVTETLHQSETEWVAAGVKLDTAHYLGEMMADERGIIQWVRVEHLLPKIQPNSLLPQSEI